jgi:hypothetical protein
MHQMWSRLSPLFSTAGINLEQFLPSELDAGASVLEHLDNAKTFVDDVAASVIGNEEADTLGLADDALAFAEAESPSAAEKLALSKVQQLTGRGFRLVKELAEKQGVLKNLPMSKVVDADGGVTWVHDHNVKEFMKHGKAAKQVRLPEEKLFLGVRSYELSRLGKQAEKGWCRCLS